MRTCAKCGKPIPMSERYCERHAKEENKRRNARQVTRNAHTAAWRKLRKERLALDGYLCQLRVDAGCTVRATSVHLDPRLGGQHARATITDVVSACLRSTVTVSLTRRARMTIRSTDSSVSSSATSTMIRQCCSHSRCAALSWALTPLRAGRWRLPYRGEGVPRGRQGRRSPRASDSGEKVRAL
jgi:hypothetical protein